ncbi:MAG: zinc ribbon domain-containing protein [Candidatus Thorarchaeota archaeon]
MNYCPYCGSKVESEWKECPNCRKDLRPKFSVSKVLIYKPDKLSVINNILGVIALIFTIIGFLTVFSNNIVGLICGIIAIVIGILGWIRDSTLAGIGIFFGIVISLYGIFSLTLFAGLSS